MKTTILLALGALILGCQMPVSSPTKTAGSGLQLNFVIAGAGSNGLSAIQARLLLPTVATLDVSLTSLKNVSAAVIKQTAAITAGANLVTVNFGKVELGDYTVKAQAFDSAGAVQFQQTGTLNLTATTTSITLNLVPMMTSTANQLAPGQTVSGSIAAGSALSWSVPPSALISGGWGLQMTPVSGVMLFAQDSDGALFPSSATTGSATTVHVMNSATSFITLYNSGTTSQPYTFVLNPPGVNGTTTIVTPANNAVIISGPATVYYGVPAIFSGSYAGTASTWSWYLDNSSTAIVNATSSTYGLVASVSTVTFGAHTLMAVAKDATTGILYSSTFAFGIANNVPATTGLVGEWLFAGNAFDTSGNANNGTVVGATLTTNHLNVSNHAYSFTAVNQSIALPNTPLSGGTSTPTLYTISVWVKPQALLSNYDQTIFGQFNNGNYLGYNTNLAVMLTIAPTPIPSTYVYPPGGASYLQTPTGIATVSWHHLVFTRNGADRKIFVDNVLQAEDIANPPTYDIALSAVYLSAPDELMNSALIGGFTKATYGPSTQTDWFSGVIDALRIYNIELTANQINALYHEGGY